MQLRCFNKSLKINCIYIKYPSQQRTRGFVLNEIEVIIKVYSDEIYLNHIKTLTCDIECEIDTDGDITYAYGWDITIGETIDKNCDKSEWKRAYAYNNLTKNVDEFFNDDGEANGIHTRSQMPFTPYVILIGDIQIDEFESKFLGKLTISKSLDDLDEHLSKLYEHPERYANYINKILIQKNQNFQHVDIVFEPEINSLQMLQWKEHYKYMFYISKHDYFFEFMKVSRSFDTYKNVEESLEYILDEVDLASKKTIENFIKDLEGLRENSWESLLNLSLARQYLE